MTNPRTDIQLDVFPEPLLAFGHGQCLEHPKDGLFLYGPLLDASKPAEIKLGVVGTADGLERFRQWSARLRRYIPPFKPNVPHHAAFPGFEAVFHTTWPERAMAELEVSAEAIRHSVRLSDRHDPVKQTVELFASRISGISTPGRCAPDAVVRRHSRGSTSLRTPKNQSAEKRAHPVGAKAAGCNS